MNLAQASGLMAAAILATATTVGCGGRGPVRTIETPQFDPRAAVAAALSAFDADGDGKLSAAEIEKSPGLEAAAPRIDDDGDKSLSQAELEKRFGLYRSAAASIVPVRYQAALDGRPLAGAVVTLTPEAFMGPAFTPCTGTTLAGGDVVLSADAIRQKGFAGVYPGIYRVTVVPAGAAGGKPATHEKGGESELGQEVAPDVPDIERAIPLPLTSRRPKSAAG